MTSPNKKMQRRLEQVKKLTAKTIAAAMNAASESLDEKLQEIQALRRIIISERAQVIYYSEKYIAFLKRECLDVTLKDFLALPESEQEPYVKRAVEELSGQTVEAPKLIVN